MVNSPYNRQFRNTIWRLKQTESPIAGLIFGNSSALRNAVVIEDSTGGVGCIQIKVLSFVLSGLAENFYLIGVRIKDVSVR